MYLQLRDDRRIPQAAAYRRIAIACGLVAGALSSRVALGQPASPVDGAPPAGEPPATEPAAAPAPSDAELLEAIRGEEQIEVSGESVANRQRQSAEAVKIVELDRAKRAAADAGEVLARS